MIEYYEQNFKEFIEDTMHLDMTELYEQFEANLPKGAKTILDLGFGSGRDSLYFQKKYEVYSIDPSLEFCKHGQKIGLKNVLALSAQEMNFRGIFDGIWACASLLHIKKEELHFVFNKCSEALKPQGILYCSFKYGIFEGYRGERYFLDQTEETVRSYLEHTNLEIVSFSISKDVRKDRTNEWLNLIVKKI